MRPFALLILTATLTFAQDAAFRAAIETETVKGDLRAAIQQYAKLGQSKDRSTAATALIRMAQCHEKLGDAEARKIYDRIVRDFSDQKEAVQTARAKLSGSSGSKAPHTRLVWDDAPDLRGTISADGRYISFIDRNTGDVCMRDLRTGSVQNITNKKDPEGTTESSALSPDGKRVAFVWDAWDKDATAKQAWFQLRVINVDGTGEKTLRIASGFIDSLAWSPDGKWIAASIAPKSERRPSVHLALISPDTGQERVLRTKNSDWKYRTRFSPDGIWIAYDEQITEDQPPVLFALPSDGSASVEAEIVRNASFMGWTPDGKTILFSRERGGSSALFSIPVSNGRPAGSPQPVYSVSNIGRPLGLTREGTLLYRLDNNQTDIWIGEIDSKTADVGQTLAQIPADKAAVGMRSDGMRFSLDGKHVLWSIPPNQVVIRSIGGEKQLTVTIQMKEVLRTEWANESLLCAGIAPNGQKGLFRVDPSTGAATFLTNKVDIDYAGVFTPSRDGRTIYYRTPAGRLSALNLDSGQDRIIYDTFERVPNLSLSHDGGKLAIRSGGVLGFLDLASGQYRQLYSRDFATDHNVMWALSWSADNRNIVIVKRDYRNARCELWSYPIDGSAPAHRLMPSEMLGLSISPDGKLAAAVRQERHPQAWALENFLPK